MSKLILGVATNSGGKYKALIDGKITNAYRTWQHMLHRAYCPKLHARRPTYIGCSVSDEWLEYQNFAKWFENHEYSNHGYELDKDLLLPNNKIYSPETCCFVPQELNKLLTSCASARGDLPQGVSRYKQVGKFGARVRVDGKQEYLGCFDTETEAHQVYKTAKERHVRNKALEWANRIEWNVFVALMNWTLDS